MKTIKNVSYSELDAAALNNGYVIEDVVTGCLIDSVLYCKPGDNEHYPMYIAGFETYLNANSSALTVKIARTPGDVEKLLKQWYEYAAAQDNDDAIA